MIDDREEIIKDLAAEIMDEIDRVEHSLCEIETTLCRIIDQFEDIKNKIDSLGNYLEG